MANVGKALHLGGFALLFVFAASISIYLYGSLFGYLNLATDNDTAATNLDYRVENTIDVSSSTSIKREATVGEIYVTLLNMEQMHVDSIVLGSFEVTVNDVKENNLNYTKFINNLRTVRDKKFSYSFINSKVIYSIIIGT